MKKLGFSIIAIMAVIVALTGCEKKRHVSEMTYKDGGDYAYLDGKPYTGDVWSDDDKTACFTYSNGELTVMTAYHDNGQVACTAGQQEGEGSKFFDTDGNAMDETQFFKTYRSVIENVAEVAMQMKRRER